MPLRAKSQRATKVATISEDSPLADDRNKGQMENASLNETSQDPSSAASSKPTNKKRVHWNHKVEKKRHHRVQDLSDDEKESVWYTEGDTKIILAMAKVTVKMMMKGEPCDDIDYCSRGLEGKTPAGSKRRQKNKLRVRKALLEEQEFQREEGVVDTEYLAQVSMKHSKEVVAEAHAVALQDEQDIQDYLNLSHGDCSPIQPRRMKRS